jgi:hypothetical protein
VHHPLLELDELDMQARELSLMVLPFQLAVASWRVILGTEIESLIEPIFPLR